jgi:hypothetical protein
MKSVPKPRIKDARLRALNKLHSAWVDFIYKVFFWK